MAGACGTKHRDLHCSGSARFAETAVCVYVFSGAEIRSKTYIDRGVAVRGELLKHRDRHGEKLPIADIVYREGLEGGGGGGIRNSEGEKERWGYIGVEW
jgi:hypothetical protein